jgi:hypothetical protein
VRSAYSHSLPRAARLQHPGVVCPSCVVTDPITHTGSSRSGVTRTRRPKLSSRMPTTSINLSISSSNTSSTSSSPSRDQTCRTCVLASLSDVPFRRTCVLASLSDVPFRYFFIDGARVWPDSGLEPRAPHMPPPSISSEIVISGHQCTPFLHMQCCTYRAQRRI